MSISPSRPEILTAYFNTQTWSEFEKSSKKYLGNKVKCNFPAGTIVALMHLDLKMMMGVAKLADANSYSSPCVEHCLLDENLHNGEYNVYSKYEIHISGLVIFPTPINWDGLRQLCGGDESVKRTTIWKGWHTPFQKVRSESPQHIELFRNFIATHLPNCH